MQLAERDTVAAVIDTLASRHLQGKIKSIKLAMVGLLAGGHVLIEDIPGLGKTTLALALARILGLSFGRVQCTSDLLPSDITGLSVYNRQEERFHFMRGPIFNNVLLVDEINRAMPKTQSALLEAMEEKRVTIEGTTTALPDPFFVIATQNPVEQVGTFPLPESQLDRFLIRTGIGYPPPAIEREIIRGGSVRDEIMTISPLMGQEQILAAQRAVRQDITLAPVLADYIYRIVAATRDHPQLLSGISTRGAINMAEGARAMAYLEGRNFVIPEDVKAVALSVGGHRLVPRPEHESINREALLASVLDSVAVPIA
jgi:MoxR-like ATPase